MDFYFLDENFMVSCDCEDDCQDKTKCACWQLSIQHTDAAHGMKGKKLCLNHNVLIYNFG